MAYVFDSMVEREGLEPSAWPWQFSNLLMPREFRSPRGPVNPRISHQICHQQSPRISRHSLQLPLKLYPFRPPSARRRAMPIAKAPVKRYTFSSHYIGATIVSTRVTRKGQITLPESVLERLGVKAGDQIEFVEYAQGVLLKRITADIRTLKGMVPKPTKPVSIEDMKQAITKMGRT
jgi:antitoxin PrlF